MEVQEVRWDRVALKQLRDYSLLYGSGNEMKYKIDDIKDSLC
jgi:hypothetical protein